MWCKIVLTKKLEKPLLKYSANGNLSYHELQIPGNLDYTKTGKRLD